MSSSPPSRAGRSPSLASDPAVPVEANGSTERTILDQLAAGKLPCCNQPEFCFQAAREGGTTRRVQALWRRIGALLLATCVLAACSGSSSYTVAAQQSELAPIHSAQACLARFNASRQLVPFETLRRAITGGYVTTDRNVAGAQAACAVLLFIGLIPHHSAVPLLFATTSTGGWRQALPKYGPLEIGSRARIPGGRPVDVSRPSDLRLKS